MSPRPYTAAATVPGHDHALAGRGGQHRGPHLDALKDMIAAREGRFAPPGIAPLGVHLLEGNLNSSLADGQRFGPVHLLVVHADDGLDEISIGAPTQVAELKNGEINCYSLTPAQFGLQSSRVEELGVADAAASLAMGTLKGEQET